MRKVYVAGKMRKVRNITEAEMSTFADCIRLYVAYEKYLGCVLIYVGLKSTDHYRSVTEKFHEVFGKNAELVCIQICT